MPRTRRIAKQARTGPGRLPCPARGRRSALASRQEEVPSPGCCKQAEEVARRVEAEEVGSSKERGRAGPPRSRREEQARQAEGEKRLALKRKCASEEEERARKVAAEERRRQARKKQDKKPSRPVTAARNCTSPVAPPIVAANCGSPPGRPVVHRVPVNTDSPAPRHPWSAKWKCRTRSAWRISPS